MTTPPFRVFSGWDHRQAEAAAVFAYSVHAHASVPVEIRFLQLANGMLCSPNEAGSGPPPMPFTRAGVTGFTYSRFLVPWLCGYEGRACFFDCCDQLCLGDVRELAEFDMQDRPLAVVKHRPDRLVPRHDRPRSWASLMLMDCSQMHIWQPRTVEDASDDRLMRLRDFADDQIAELPPEWNALCGFEVAQVETTRAGLDGGPRDDVRTYVPGAQRSIEPEGAKMLHWSHLSDPNGGPWIDRSGSALWAEWRERSKRM